MILLLLFTSFMQQFWSVAVLNWPILMICHTLTGRSKLLKRTFNSRNYFRFSKLMINTFLWHSKLEDSHVRGRVKLGIFVCYYYYFTLFFFKNIFSALKKKVEEMVGTGKYSGFWNESTALVNGIQSVRAAP